VKYWQIILQFIKVLILYFSLR